MQSPLWGEKKEKKSGERNRGRRVGRTRPRERDFAGRVTAISAFASERASEGVNETRERFRAEERRSVQRGGGWPRAQIPHENSTIAHLPPVDTEHSRGALTYRVRHI